MGDKRVYFGDDFGQKIDLTVRIREILRNYPEGTSIFKELVQNADDAGATKVTFCLDLRQHPVDGLAYEKMSPFQGPALVVHNDATFTDADFESIQRIGDSLKKDDSKGWKTGRFGVGFNSVYHLTDLPAFVSGSHLVFFDPQACHLPNVNPSNPGKIVDFVSHPGIVNDFPAQVAPFRGFGCDFNGSYKGTIFRLALRSTEQAKVSRLSNREQTPTHMIQMLEEFAASIHLVLLFLRNVTCIKLLKWDEDQSAPSLVCEASVTNATDELRSKRSLTGSMANGSRRFDSEGQVCDYQIDIAITKPNCSVGLARYFVANQLGGGKCSMMANDLANADQRLVPWGGIAARLPSNQDSSAAEQGLAFCFLPLPTHTYLPVHVNGYFELSSNRRDIWFGEGLSGAGLVRAMWNKALLEHVIAPCYARALLHLTDQTLLPPHLHATLLPSGVSPEPWDTLTNAVFELIKIQSCLYSTASGGIWVAPADALIVKRSLDDYEDFIRWLLEDDVPVVTTLSEAAENALVRSRATSRFLSSKDLRSQYRLRSSRHAGNCDAIKSLLSFMFRDLDEASLVELDGVKLLPLCDDSLGTYRKPADDEHEASLLHLCSMGFSRSQSLHALQSTGNGDVENALNWLISNPNPPAHISEVRASNQVTHFMPTEDERRLLSRAQAQLVDISAIPSQALKLLSSNNARRFVNIRSITIEDFEDLLSLVFPREWRGQSSVEWRSHEPTYSNFDEEWIRLLWRYLGPSSQLQSFQDKWPILPTESGELWLLSPVSGVVSAELLPPSCLAALTKLRVPVLLKNLFVVVQPHSDIWNYVHQPTPGGVLSCLARICEAPEFEVKKLFHSVSSQERKKLREFLLDDSVNELDYTQRMVLHKLPIFDGVVPNERVSDLDVRWTNESDDEALLTEHSPVYVALNSSAARSTRSICPGVKWPFLDEHFVSVGDLDRAAIDALTRLSIKSVTKAKFFANSLIPRLDKMPKDTRTGLIRQLLRELSLLLSEDPEGDLARLVETTPMFPAINGDLKRIIDLYDPDIDEFSNIMDDTFFPARELQEPQPLSVLRSIGLQRQLTRRSVLSLACSIEAEQTRVMQCDLSQDGLEPVVTALQSRAVEFFKYVDSHVDQLVNMTVGDPRAKKKKMKTPSLKLWRTLVGDASAQSDERQRANLEQAEIEQIALERNEINDFIAKMNVIDWAPVSHQLHPSLPRHCEDIRIVVARPECVRLPKDQSLCSSEYHILGRSIHSAALRQLFTWNHPIAVEDVARQLRAVAIKSKQNKINSHPSESAWSAVYEIYKMLSRFFENGPSIEQREHVLSLLSGDVDFIWVGSGFVAPHRVALTTVVNAEPYLFGVSSEMVHFRPFLKAVGVRERFGTLDYVGALGLMHSKCQAPKSPGKEESRHPLSNDELIAAIGLVQLISDSLSHHADHDLFAPDTNSILVRSVNLSFDDAPWLDKRDINLGTVELIHPKISNEVAAKIGAKSLRSLLLHANQSDSLFTLSGDLEAFGQTEALTKRISHILEQYPDGPHIISELIQNADDAGATKVCLMYSDVTFGSSSLLSPAMAKWQGPALYCYNDAEFQDSDFISLARIGQGGKLQKVSTTGRFGLGFNSVYHFTDLPSIVSANSLVMFDPHATHLPVTPANPGVRVRFVNSSLPHQFPDQFEPFKLFGCDLTSHFHGSLFRFPLRHEGIASASEIKQRAYRKQDMFELLESFRATVADAMIFLRNVRTVEVLLQANKEDPPVLLYCAEVPASERGESWRQIDRFIAGGESRLDRAGGDSSTASKAAFYSRLARTPVADLPSVTQTLHIKTRERQNLAKIFQSMHTALVAQDGADVWAARTDEFLVRNQIGGGRAREMACAPENASLKLIPWVGIAARLQGHPVDGRAFCFLPLPVRTGLPVHINGYFELSSNRRDIWHGDDLSGDGKLRSEWNESLLRDAVAPAYVAFLLEAKNHCGRHALTTYVSLFPVTIPPQPWSDLVRAFFIIARDKPVLSISPSALHNPGKPIAPGSAVLVDESVEGWEALEGALNSVFTDTVRVPDSLRQIMVELDAVHGTFSPTFFRKLVRSGRFLPSLETTKTTKVIEFCLSDGRDTSAHAELNKLPIVPSLSGAFKPFLVFDVPHNDPVDLADSLFFVNELESQLLPHFCDWLVGYQSKSLFESMPSLFQHSNLFQMKFSVMSKWFLPKILPADWKRSDREVHLWEPNVQSHHPSSDWLLSWWRYVELALEDGDTDGDTKNIEQTHRQWPLLPVILANGEEQKILVHAGETSKMALIPHPRFPVPTEMMETIPSVLSKLGVATIDSTFVNGPQTVTWMIDAKLLFPLSVEGFLSALSTRLSRDSAKFTVQALFGRLNELELDVIANFVASGKIEDITDSNLALLRDLPVFRMHNEVTGIRESKPVFRSIQSGSYLPGENSDLRVLGPKFFLAPRKSSTREFLRSAGVEEWSSTQILLEHVFPYLPILVSQGTQTELIISVVQNALLELPFHQRQNPQFRDALKDLPVVLSQKMTLRRISDLYDPNNRDLGELVGPNSLPHESFGSSEMIAILRSLGLRDSLSCHAIVESAHSVEALATSSGSVEEAWKKALSLLKVVNRSFDDLASDFSSDRADGHHARLSIDGIVTSLRETKWLPVHDAQMKPFMPWPSFEISGKRFASAETTRPENDAWNCSLSTNILFGQLRSDVLIEGFGWKQPVDVKIVAAQLAAIGETVSSSGRNDFTSPDFKLAILETQRIYQMLDEILSTGDPDVIEWLRAPLGPAPWVWTGKCFVRMQQVAVDSDVDFEPLLFAAPPDVLVPRSLLIEFGLKEQFDSMDYVLALRSLSQTNDVLSHSEQKTCLKLFEQIASSISSSESLNSFVILDESGRLVPARELMYDDMEWNESSEVRRGCRFVNRKVSRETALALGAKSLHSRLAETSVTSTQLVCPSASLLKKILPKRDRWFEAFLSEILLAAEKFGGSQVDFFVDYRKHPGQRVIQPSFQVLQEEAICVHIHDMVLSTHDVNGLFGGEMSRPGFLSGFTFSDCLQILSGDGFYVLDPTTEYLSTSTSQESNSSRGLARRYDILGEDFLRYPDQLLPFCTLPSCPSNVGSGTRSTLLRFPWRKFGSSLSSYAVTEKTTTNFVSFVRSQLEECLVFTESVYRVSLWSVGKGSEFAIHTHGEAALDSPEYTLRRRKSTRQNNDWKKKFSFQSFFKTPVAPENQMEFVVKLEVENKRYKDMWLFSDIVGAGRSRDLAVSAVHEVLNSIPYVSVACRLFRDGDPAPPLRGKLHKIVKTSQDIGLPIHINGCFKKQLHDSLVLFNSARSGLNDEQAISTHWNRVLLEDGVLEAYSKLLHNAKRRYESSFPKAFYRVWPSKVKTSDFAAVLVQSQLYRKLETQEFFLCTDGIFRSLNGGYVVDVAGMDLQVVSFAQLHFPSFDIPDDILEDAKRLVPSRVFSLAPRTMRRFLRNVRATDIHAGVCLSLLEYCLSDMTFPLPAETDAMWGEFQGLPLLPLENGSVGHLGTNQRGRYVLGSFNQIQLLMSMAHTFVSLEARQRLQPFFSDARFVSQMGIGQFSIKTLSDNIHTVLPAGWKNQPVVDWAPNSAEAQISELWMHRFWSEVRFERRSLAYFGAWPLIPVQGSRLLSCGKPDAAVCIWSCAFDQELRARVHLAASEAAHQDDERLAALDLERKKLRELSTQQRSREDGLEHWRVSEESGEEIVNFGDPELDGETKDEEDEPAQPIDGDVTRCEENDEALDHDRESGIVAIDPPSDTAGTDAIRSVGDSIRIGSSDRVEINQSQQTGEPVDELAGIEVRAEEEVEFFSREVLHGLLSRLNVSLIELAYLGGQEVEIVPSSRDAAIAIVDGICSSEQAMLKWTELAADDATRLAEYFSEHSRRHGGFNRMHIERLKRLPIYVNICGAACALDEGEHFLIPVEIDLTAIPLPPNARQRFMQPNPRLTAFYKDLGVEDMSYGKLLLFLLPFYNQLLPPQRDAILQLIKEQWPSLRGDSVVVGVLRSTPLFASDDGALNCADTFLDPRNKVLRMIYADVQGSFPIEPMKSSDAWLNLMVEIGLRSEITGELFIECARRLEAVYANRSSLSAQDESVINALHEFFVQNFDKYDRSRLFFESVGTIKFVPAVRYENSLAGRGRSSVLSSRTVLVTYADCATPDDQSLVFSRMPILTTSALPPRVLWSRLGLQSPPPKSTVLEHLHYVVESGRESISEAWLFFTPVMDAFQSMFKYLQEEWDQMAPEERVSLTNLPLVPVGSSLVKGNRLYFHLTENLAPLMFEVPRAFGAYDTLFRSLGSKDSPEVQDYVVLLREVATECGDDVLNLNELVSVTRIVSLLADGLSEQNKMLSKETLQHLYLPSTESTIRQAARMAYNDAPWICARVDLADLQIVHPRVSPTRCDALGVSGISCVVSEELETQQLAVHPEQPQRVQHMNAVLASQQFGSGLRTLISAQHQKATGSAIIDFEDLHRRILALGSYQVRAVDTLRSRFIAKLGHPPRQVDVTKASVATGSISFVDSASKVIYVATKTLKANKGVRLTQVIGGCVNQLLGGAVQDCSAIESMLSCDAADIQPLLHFLNIEEDPALITEKLRGAFGELLCESDLARVELAPLRSFFIGEVVAVERDGGLRYGKIMEDAISETGVNQFEVRIRQAETKWFPATAIYSFKSSRGGQSRARPGQVQDRSESFVARLAERKGGAADMAFKATASLPQSVVARGSSSGTTSVIPSGVTPVTVVAAVNDLLGKLNLSLDSTFDELIAENLRLQRRLDQAEEGRRLATAQVDDALREKKDAQETLVCAICLENKVDRVLIPCGHIYCGSCVAQLPRQTCPICRHAISSTSQFHVPS